MEQEINPSLATRRRILVLEDDQEMSAVVCEALRADGYEVTGLANGRVAIADLVARHTTHWHVPDLLVTDLRLPGYSGIEVLRRLRRHGCVVPAVVMSGFADEEIRASTAELGIIAIFEKPFDIDDLRMLVRHHIGA